MRIPNTKQKRDGKTVVNKNVIRPVKFSIVSKIEEDEKTSDNPFIILITIIAIIAKDTIVVIKVLIFDE